MTSGRTSGTEYFCSFCSEGEQQAGKQDGGEDEPCLHGNMSVWGKVVSCHVWLLLCQPE